MFIRGIRAEPVGDVSLVSRVVREVVGALVGEGDALLVALALASVGRSEVPAGGPALATLIDALADLIERHHGAETSSEARRLLLARLAPVLGPLPRPAADGRGSGFRRKVRPSRVHTVRVEKPLEVFERTTARPPRQTVSLRRRGR